MTFGKFVVIPGNADYAPGEHQVRMHKRNDEGVRSAVRNSLMCSEVNSVDLLGPDQNLPHFGVLYFNPHSLEQENIVATRLLNNYHNDGKGGRPVRVNGTAYLHLPKVSDEAKDGEDQENPANKDEEEVKHPTETAVHAKLIKYVYDLYTLMTRNDLDGKPCPRTNVKRALSAFAFFLKNKPRDESMKQKFPQMVAQQQEEWNNMSVEQKAPYVAMEQEDKLRNSRQTAEYLKQHPTVPHGPRSAYQFFRKDEKSSGGKIKWDSVQDKSSWEAMAEKDKKRYEQEIKAFELYCAKTGVHFDYVVNKKKSRAKSKAAAKASVSSDAEMKDSSSESSEEAEKPVRKPKRSRSKAPADVSAPKPRARSRSAPSKKAPAKAKKQKVAPEAASQAKKRKGGSATKKRKPAVKAEAAETMDE